MHIEILTEDSSGQRLLEHLVPKLIGPLGEPHTWRLHAYRGIGRIPAHLSPASDPSRRILLDQLPRLLRGYVRDSGHRRSRRGTRRRRSELRDLPRRIASRLPHPVALPTSHYSALRLKRWRPGTLAIASPCVRAYPNARLRALDWLCSGLGLRHVGDPGGSNPSGWSSCDPTGRVASAGSGQARMGRTDRASALPGEQRITEFRQTPRRRKAPGERAARRTSASSASPGSGQWMTLVNSCHNLLNVR